MKEVKSITRESLALISLAFPHISSAIFSFHIPATGYGHIDEFHIARIHALYGELAGAVARPNADY